MKTLWVGALFAAVMLIATPSAFAQSRAIPADDPAAFARTVAQQIARDRTEPIRRTMVEIRGTAALPAEVDAGFITMERYLNGVAADQIVMIEDTQLANAVRSIYYLHTFGDPYMLTRFDFVRYPSGWKLTTIAFANSWQGIALRTTPSWTAAP